MKKLHRLIILTYLGPFVLTFFITLFILVMQFLWKYIDELVGKGLELHIVAELLFYASANLVPMALPLAILLSSIMTFGNLGEHYELVALKSSGLSLQRIMMPLILVIGMTSVAAFFFSNNVWPMANLKFASLLYDVRHKKPALDIKSGVFYKGIDNFVIRIEDNQEGGKFLKGILIYDHTEDNGNRKVTRAETGKMQVSEDNRYLLLTLFDGESYEEIEGKTFPLFRAKFKEEVIRFDLAQFQMIRSEEDLFKNNYQMQSIDRLSYGIDSLMKKRSDRMDKFQLTISHKIGIARKKGKVVDTTRAGPKPDSTRTAIDSMGNAKVDSIPVAEVDAVPVAKIDSVQVARLDSVRIAEADSIRLAKIDLLNDYIERQEFTVTESAANITRSTKVYIAALANEMESKSNMIDRHKIEWHRKFTLATACIVLFFIGAPLGAIIRKGGLGMPVVVSVLFFLVFHISNITGEKIVKQGNLEPAIGMWIATMILTPIGIFLTYKATTDSPLLDRDSYSRVFDKMLSRLRKPRKKGLNA